MRIFIWVVIFIVIVTAIFADETKMPAQPADSSNSGGAPQNPMPLMSAGGDMQKAPDMMEMNRGMTMMTSTAAVEFRMVMRKLWADHITWNRNYIISALADLGDVDAVTRRLLKNQDDLGRVIKPYFGDEAGQRLALLLRGQVMITAEVVKAAKANNVADQEKTQDKWKAHGNETADFLASVNPNWSKQMLRDMMAKHLELTTMQCLCRTEKRWKGDIEAYDMDYDQMMTFADVMAKGIIKQFPDKFTDQMMTSEVKPHVVTDAEVGMTAVCPVSKMAFKVTKDTPSLEYKGRLYYFCTDQCPVTFSTNPAKYAER